MGEYVFFIFYEYNGYACVGSRNCIRVYVIEVLEVIYIYEQQGTN